MYKLLGVEVESSTHYRDSRQVFICAAAVAAARTTQGPRTLTQGSRSQRQLQVFRPVRGGSRTHGWVFRALRTW